LEHFSYVPHAFPAVRHAPCRLTGIHRKESHAMPQEDMNRQMGGRPDAGDSRDGQAAYDAGRRQFGDDVRRHVDAGHGEQRTYSPRGIAADGTYVGHAGGYVGGRGTGAPAQQAGFHHGEGTYGYPYGQGIGLVGERHPDDEAATLGDVGAPHDAFGPGDRFGAGRTAEWLSPSFDPGYRDAEYMEFRNAHGRRLDCDYREFAQEQRRGFAQMFEEWRARRRQAAEAAPASRPAREDDSGF
jgi:hypothetical protein